VLTHRWTTTTQLQPNIFCTMAALQFPLPDPIPGIALPPVSSHPPTNDDVEHALNYLNRVQRACSRNEATFAELESAYAYFAHIVDGPGPIRRDPPGLISRMMAPIYEEIALMQKEIRRLDINLALHLNSQLNYGKWAPFAIVYFPDGSDPTAPPVRALTLLFFKRLT